MFLAQKKHMHSKYLQNRNVPPPPRLYFSSGVNILDRARQWFVTNYTTPCDTIVTLQTDATKAPFFPSKHFGVTKTKRGNPKCRWLCELVSPFSKCRYTLCPLTCSNLSGVHLHTSLPPIDKKQVIQKRDVFPKGEEYDQHMNKNSIKHSETKQEKTW